MTRITKTLTLTIGVIAAFAVLTFLMFSFASNAEAHQAGARAVGSKLEVSIADSGRVIVRGAEVTDISTDEIRARTEWGGTSLTWTVDTNADTVFVTKSGSGSDLDEISVGDYISFSGALNEDQATLTVTADAVKNWSLDGERDHDTRAELRTELRAEAKNGWGKFMSNLPVFGWFKDHNNR